MGRVWTLTVGASLIAAMAGSPAAAQPPGGGGGRMGGMSDPIVALLENADVQKDLKLTDAEKGSISLLKDELKEGDKKFREATQDLEFQERFAKMGERRKEIEKQIKEVFGDKAARLKQIQRQQAGIASALGFDRELGETMSITEEQRQQYGEYMQSQREAMREAFQTAGDDPEARRKMFEEMQEKNKKKAEELLTADQKKKWAELIGTPVTYKLPPAFGGGRRGGPGGGRPPADKGGEKKKPPMA